MFDRTAIFTAVKNSNFHMKKCDIFPFFSKNIDCGYKLEPTGMKSIVTDNCHFFIETPNL